MISSPQLGFDNPGYIPDEVEGSQSLSSPPEVHVYVTKNDSTPTIVVTGAEDITEPPGKQ